MTQLDVMYRFGMAPVEATAVALGKVREIYGIRNLHLDQAAHTIRVEYDATRLTEPAVQNLLRRAGLDLEGRVPLVQPPAPPEPANPSSTT